MSIRGIFFDMQQTTAADHGLIFSRAVSDRVMSGGQVTNTYNTVFINAGFVMMGGRVWEIQGNEAVSVSNTGGYAYARIKAQIDLTQASTGADNFQQVNFVVEYASDLEEFADLVTDAINTGGGSIYEMEAALVSIDSESGITAVVRKWA